MNIKKEQYLESTNSLDNSQLTIFKHVFVKQWQMKRTLPL